LNCHFAAENNNFLKSLKDFCSFALFLAPAIFTKFERHSHLSVIFMILVNFYRFGCDNTPKASTEPYVCCHETSQIKSDTGAGDSGAVNFGN
jgi:hypothetical protein